MSSRVHLRPRLIEDRKQGVSLLNLSKRYGLSKSTVSLWCRGVVLSKTIKDTIKQRWLKGNAKARAKGVLTNKQKRKDSIESEYVKAGEIIGSTNVRDLLIMGVGLYWAEGSKKERGSGFSFINSDHLMIKLMYDWLTKIVYIRADQLIVNLVVNSNQSKRESDILKFWSNLLY